MVVTDLVGVDQVEKWYVECKRYQNSIDWPTVWKKIAYADSQCADVFLLATNSNPSPACESEISNWNNQNRTPRIRVLRGYSLIELLSTKSHIRLCHGLESKDTRIDKQALYLSRIILGVVQVANSSLTFGFYASVALETASVLSELLEQRLSDIETHGYFGSGHMCGNTPTSPPAWLEIAGDYSEIEEIAYYSTAGSLVYFSGAKSISTNARDRGYTFCLEEPTYNVNDRSPSLITVLEWACAEIEVSDEHSGRGRIRFRDER